MSKRKSHNVWTASSEGDVDGLRESFEGMHRKDKKVKLNSLRDNHNWTPLHHAVTSKSYECVELLLNDTNVDPEAKCFEGNTALSIACEINSTIEVIKLLIKSCKNAINMANHFSIVPLHKAIELKRLDIVELLVENGADVNLKDYSEETPLHCACEKGYLDIVIYLLYVAKADHTIKNEHALNPLNLMAVRGSFDIPTKVACFKLLYNIKHPRQRHNPCYKLNDHLFEVAILSRRNSSLIPFFLDNTYSKDNSKLPLINDIRKYLPYQAQLLALILHDNIDMLSEASKRDYFEALYYNYDIYKIIFKSLVHEDINRLNTIINFLLELRSDTVVAYTHPFIIKLLMKTTSSLLDQEDVKPEIYERFQRLANIAVFSTSKSVDDLIILLVQRERSDKFERKLNLYHQILSMLTPYFFQEMVKTHEILGNDNFLRLSKICPFETLLSMERMDQKKYINLNDFTLKRLSRDVLRKQVFSNSLQTNQEFIPSLQLLQLPHSLLNYLKFID